MAGFVISDRPEEFMGKRGMVKNQVIVVVDNDASGHRCVQPIEYSMSEPERDKYAGKLLDKKLELGIRELSQFGGRIRARGQIIKVL